MHPIACPGLRPPASPSLPHTRTRSKARAPCSPISSTASRLAVAKRSPRSSGSWLPPAGRHTRTRAESGSSSNQAGLGNSSQGHLVQALQDGGAGDERQKRTAAAAMAGTATPALRWEGRRPRRRTWQPPRGVVVLAPPLEQQRAPVLAHKEQPSAHLLGSSARPRRPCTASKVGIPKEPCCAPLRGWETSSSAVLSVAPAAL